MGGRRNRIEANRVGREFAALIESQIRLALSLAGASDGVTVWVNINAIIMVSVVVFSIRVHTTGFGGYKHLLALVALEQLVGQIIIGGGNLLVVDWRRKYLQQGGVLGHV